MVKLEDDAIEEKGNMYVVRMSETTAKAVSFSEENPRKHLCKQVSIESPSSIKRGSMDEAVFSFDVPIPEVHPDGARVKVICAGVCYRRRDSTVHRSNELESGSSCILGFREAALFPGFEVAGIVDAVGSEVSSSSVQIGDRVIVYPYDEIPHGYAEYISVPSLDYLVKIPTELPLPVASMLPTGALWALNAVFDAKSIVDNILESRNDQGKVKILMVGTGGLALWALRTALYYFRSESSKVEVTVATLKDEGVAQVAEEYGNRFKVVTWSEDLHEAALIERTLETCEGKVDVVINFGTTTRILLRCLQCLDEGGTVMIGSESSDFLIRKFKTQCEDNRQTIKNVPIGSFEQLTELVDLVVRKEIIPPPYMLFPADKAAEVLRMVAKNEVKGRAILQFADLE